MINDRGQFWSPINMLKLNKADIKRLMLKLLAIDSTAITFLQ